MGTVSPLDLIIVLLAVLSVLGGYRRGAVLQAFGLAGVVLGLGVGALVAPHAVELASGRAARAGIALGCVLVGATAGNVGGALLGIRVRARIDRGPADRADRIGGVALSVGALVLAIWFLALNLANGPFPQLARGIRDSRIVAGIADLMPPPPPLMSALQRVAGQLGFPDAFVGLPPVPAPPVDPPPSSVVTAAADAARPSTVEVLASGCIEGYLNQGSGFVVAPGYVVTNAHVVAGTHGQVLASNGARFPASVVLFDPGIDIALLYAPTFHAPPLALATGEMSRGTGGAVLGFPGGGGLEVGAAAVRQALDAVGRDIYGHGEVTRHIDELQATVHRGNSGGPFALPGGRVAAVVFANSVLDDGVAYAITAAQFAPDVRGAVGRTAPVGTGACTMG
jgi:S1-C subfamily serine protease